jgi:lysophospholipase L1-like esterase
LSNFYERNYLGGRRFRISLFVRGKGQLRFGFLFYSRSEGRPEYVYGDPKTELTNHWTEVSRVFDFGNRVPKRLAPFVELASNGELFFDDFSIREDIIPGTGIKALNKHTIMVPKGKTTLRFKLTRPDDSARVFVYDQPSRAKGALLKADSSGMATFDFKAPATPGSFRVDGVCGGNRAPIRIDVVSSKFFKSMENAARSAAPLLPDQVLIIGDSLTDFDRGANWVDKVEFFLKKNSAKRISLRNAAVRGDYITRVEERLAGRRAYRRKAYNGIFSPKPGLILIFLGHNDTRTVPGKPVKTPLVTPEEQLKSYRNVIARLRREVPNARIVLVTPSCSLYEVCRQNAERKVKSGRPMICFGEPELMKRYIKVLKKLATELNCEFLDLYTPMKALPDRKSLFRAGDGVHLSEAGHRFVADYLMRYLAATPPSRGKAAYSGR